MATKKVKKKGKGGCFGGCVTACVKAPASKAPVKLYNIYIPLMFLHTTQPNVDDPISHSAQKYMKKILEYCEKNPFRLPKVSRRLQRHIDRDLKSGNLGDVKIAVHAYIYLLSHLPSDKTDFLAPELIRADKCVINTLLTNPSVECRILGCSLFSRYVQKEDDSDELQHFERHMKQICTHAHARGTGMKAAAPEKIEELNVAALLAIRANMKYTVRTGSKCALLDSILTMVLDNLAEEPPPPTSAPPTAESPMAADLGPTASGRGARHKRQSSDTTIDIMFSKDLEGFSGFAADRGTAKPSMVAAEVLKQIGLLSGDPALGKRVLDVWMKYLDAGHHWSQGRIATVSAGILRRAFGQTHQAFGMLQGLLRHASCPPLSTADRAAVVRAAVNAADGLDAAMALSALSLALHTLPQVLPTGHIGARGTLEDAIMEAMRHFTYGVSEGSQVLQTYGNALQKADTQEVGMQMMECMMAGLRDNPAARNASLNPRSFAKVLLIELISLMVSGEEARRLQAHQLLRLAMPLAGEGLKDEHVQAACSAILHIVTRPTLSGSADIFQELDSMMGSIVDAAKPIGVVCCARLVMRLAEVAQEPFEDEGEAHTPPRAVHALATLMLASSMARRISASCETSTADIMAAGPVMEPADLPDLELTGDGLTALVHGPLGGTCNQEAITSCAASVSAFQPGAFATALVNGLSESKRLTEDDDDGLSDAKVLAEKLREPFVGSRIPHGELMTRPTSNAYSFELGTHSGQVAQLRTFITTKDSFAENDRGGNQLESVHDVLAYAKLCSTSSSRKTGEGPSTPATASKTMSAGTSVPGASMDLGERKDNASLQVSTELRWAAAEPLRHALQLVDDLLQDSTVPNGGPLAASAREGAPHERAFGLDPMLMNC